jgi:hypothetical protein
LDPAQIRAVENLLTTHNGKRIKTFPKMVSHYKIFFQNFSRISLPLHRLLKTETKFEWTEAQEHTFQNFKSKLITLPILQYPDFTSDFGLMTDNIVSQGDVGKDPPVTYTSRSMNNAELVL